MKRLLLTPLLLTLLVASCSTNKKYNSIREASDACNEWADKGGFYIKVFVEQTTGESYPTDKVKKYFPEQKIEIPLRFCEKEMETKQILGLTTTNHKNGKLTYPANKEPCRYDHQCNSRWSNDETRVDKNFYF